MADESEEDLSQTAFQRLRQEIHASLERATRLSERTGELLLAADLLESRLRLDVQRGTPVPRSPESVPPLPQRPRETEA